jgi:uncharacterized membrane protein YjgN (DUF898 family)
MSWYYKDGDQEIGPVSKAKLQELINSRRINGKTLIRNAAKQEWKPLAEMVRKKPEPQPSIPVPQPSIPDPQASIPDPQATIRWDPDSDEPPPTADETAPPIPRAPGRSEGQLPFEFKGTGGQYFKIWIVNVVLSIITIGIYSAWAKVRRKQYFYGNTRVAGAAFRYLADPVKILKGRIVVFIGFAIYSAANNFLPPAVGFVLLIGFMVIMPWLVVRSMAFNARNSSWRNIRFNFTGTYAEAAKVFILWPLLVPFTLGILSPYVFYRQKKFIVERSAYGTAPFMFKATPKDYYAIVFKFVVYLLGLLILAAGIGFLLQKLLPALLPMASIVFPILMVAVYLYAFAYFSIKTSNLLYNSGRLKAHGFKATMQVNAYALIVLTNTLATVVTLGLFHPFAQVRAYRYKINNLSMLAKGDLDQFVAAELKETSALGDELSDFLDFDFGL